MQARSAPAALLLVCVAAAASAQTTAIDFDRDVKPLLRDKCVGCHGPAQQNGGLRLDRRQSALVGGASGVAILPGNAARSLLVSRISGSASGPQMPPTGPLPAEDVATLGRWIDAGAPWPETTRPAAPDTPLMRAALAGTIGEMRALLARGADVNAANGAGATALMWSVHDPQKVRLLLDRGADAGARSEDGRTALHVAAVRGDSEVVQLLLAHGASATAKAAGAAPIDIAANSGNPAALEALLKAGATPGADTAANAAFVECLPCLDLLRRYGLPAAALGPALAIAIFMDGAPLVEHLLEAGAPLDRAVLPPSDYTPLMLAAYADRDSDEKTRLLVAAGADPSAKTPHGESIATVAAKKTSRAALAATRPEAGAVAGIPAAAAIAAVRNSAALLQKSDVVFTKNSGCISCHHEMVPAMLVALAARKKIQVDAAAARAQRQRTLAYLDDRRERLLQGFDISGAPASAGYLLLALDAQRQPRTPSIEALARLLEMTQLPDGRWRIQAQRPPIESTDITATAVSLRGVQLYAAPSRRAEWAARIAAARRWLEAAPATSTEEKAFRLLGLAWAGASRESVGEAARALAAAQRADGGWAQLPTLDSDAYSTGQALYALHEAGGMTAVDTVYQRGAAFLLRTQKDDGSWLVKSRSIPIQAYFETGFPHGADQFISAAGTAWAAIALTLALP